MAVVDADAALEQVDRPILARVHLVRIQHGISLYRENRTAGARWRNARRALIATEAFRRRGSGFVLAAPPRGRLAGGIWTRESGR